MRFVPRQDPAHIVSCLRAHIHAEFARLGSPNSVHVHVDALGNWWEADVGSKWCVRQRQLEAVLGTWDSLHVLMHTEVSRSSKLNSRHQVAVCLVCVSVCVAWRRVGKCIPLHLPAAPLGRLPTPPP